MRKVSHHLVTTGRSVAVGLLIGTIEVAGLPATELHLRGGPWGLLADYDIDRAGVAVAAPSVVVRVVALSSWCLADVGGRWAAPSEAAGPPGRRR